MNKSLFISDEPTLEDQFGTHEKIAEQISDFIGNLEEGTTIALKGKWGSGKSSVIEILKEKTKDKNFKIFVFDVWAELGHNFRQAFLLNFLDWSAKEEAFEKNNNSYENKRLEILGKKKTVHRKVSPTKRTALLHLFIFILMLTIIPNILFFFLSNLSDNIIRNLSLLSIFSFPLTILLVYYFFSMDNEISKKSLKIFLHVLFIIWLLSYGVWLIYSINYLFFSSLKFILFLKAAIIIYWSFLIFMWLFTMFMEGSKDMITIVSIYSGLLIGEIRDNEETKSLSDNSLDFKKEFINILNKITTRKNEKIKIIIVIDNVDRIPEEKVDEVFAALKPFMISDESKKNNVLKNVFYIIPFDPDGIRIGTDKGGYDYFNKLFKKEFYVPEPIYGNWQKYFEQISRKLKVNIPTYLFEIAFQITIGFKNYLEEVKTKKDKEDLKNPSEDGKASFEIEKVFIPPTPREIKKFLNNYMTIVQQYSEIKHLDKSEEVFPYILFAVLKTYGMLNSSNELEKLFLEKFQENKSVFELYITKKGYNVYSFIEPNELVYKLYGLYYSKDFDVGYIVLQLPKLRKILSEPVYNREFRNILSQVPDLFKDVFESRLKDLFIDITDSIYSKEPQLTIGIGVYLKELKENFNGVYESIKDKLYSTLKDSIDKIEEFISKLDEKIFDDKKTSLSNVIESILFIQKEANLDLINPILKFSKNKVRILKEFIEYTEHYKNQLDIQTLQETFYDPERDAPYLIELLDYIGKKLKKRMNGLITDIISSSVVLSNNMIDKCFEIFSNKIAKEPASDDYFFEIIVFLNGLGKVLAFDKYAEEREEIQKLVLHKFSSNFLSKILSLENFNRSFIYIKSLLTLYSYFYSAKTKHEIHQIINSLNNNYKRINSSLLQDQNKVLSSSLTLLLLVYDDIKNLNIIHFTKILNSSNDKDIIEFIRTYEMENFFKKEEIVEIYNYLIKNIPSSKDKILSLYRLIYENILKTEEHDLSWVFNLYTFLKNLSVSLEEVKKCIKNLNSNFSFENIKIDKYNIELLDYLFTVSEKKEIIKEFERIINEKLDKDVREELFTQVTFYECCSNHQVRLDGKFHKKIFKAILDNLENFSKDSVEKIANFLVIQSDLFIEDFIKDFKQTIESKAHSIDDIESSEREIDFIFEKFNFIFEKLIQEKREILEKYIDNEFIRTLENLNDVKENIERFIIMMKGGKYLNLF